MVEATAHSPAPALERRAPAASWLLYAPLLSATVLSKIAVPPLGERGLGVAFLVLAATLALGLLGDRFRVDSRRLALYLMMLSMLFLPQILRQDAYSPASLLLLAALHSVYVLRIEGGDRSRIADAFIALCTVLAWLGVAQFVLQFFVEARWAFPIENFAPRAFVVQLFNHQAPLYYGAELYRANGVFLVEPSIFSQLMAIALVVELCARSRWSRLTPLAAALIFSYSGTGLIVLAVALPLVVTVHRRWDLLLWAAGAAALLAVFREHLMLDLLLERSGELNASGSSGFARFVGGFHMFEQFLWNDPARALLGFGAGAFNDYAPLARFTASEMPLFKMVFEFGLLGAAVYFGFIFYCVFATRGPLPARAAIAASLLLNGMYMPFAHALALSLLVWPWDGARQRPRSSPSASPARLVGEPAPC